MMTEVYVGNSILRDIYTHIMLSGNNSAPSTFLRYRNNTDLKGQLLQMESISKIIFLSGNILMPGYNQNGIYHINTYKPKKKIEQLLELEAVLVSFCPLVFYIECPPRGFKGRHEKHSREEFTYWGRRFRDRYSHILQHLKKLEVVSWNRLLSICIRRKFEHIEPLLEMSSFHSNFMVNHYRDNVHPDQTLCRVLGDILSQASQSSGFNYDFLPTFVVTL